MTAAPTRPTSARPAALRVAPQVSHTPLPFGGCVLVHGRSLALLECGLAEAAAIARLLEGRTETGDERIARQLVDDGWLVPQALSAPQE